MYPPVSVTTRQCPKIGASVSDPSRHRLCLPARAGVEIGVTRRRDLSTSASGLRVLLEFARRLG